MHSLPFSARPEGRNGLSRPRRTLLATVALFGAVSLSAAACDSGDSSPPIPLEVSGSGGSGGTGGTGGSGGGPSGMGGGGAGGGMGGGGSGGGIVNVQLVAFNDFHGNLEPSKALTVITQQKSDTTAEVKVEAGGAAYFAAHVAALRAANPNTLLVSAGDTVGGSPLASALFHDEPTVELMNAIGLEVNGIGNHEFDEGRPEVLRLINGGCHPIDGCKFTPPGSTTASYPGADYPVLAANVIDEEGKMFLPPVHEATIGGAKIAFIGLTFKNTPSVVTAGAIEGLTFNDEVATVNALVPGLKAGGADAIVVLIHQGGVQTGLYNECVGLTGDILPIVDALDPAIEVVVSGHTHQAYNCTRGDRLLTSALSFGRLLTKIELSIDTSTHKIVSKQAENKIVSRDVTPDPTAQGILEVTLATAGPLANEVVGQILGDISNQESADHVNKVGESAFGDLIADAQLANTLGEGTQIAFMNPGGIRAPLLFSPGGNVADGNVTFGALFAAQPFSNYLVTMTLTGAQIETLLEQQIFPIAPLTGRILQVSQGFTYTWDASKATDAAAGKVDVDPTTIKLNGVTLNPTGAYRVTVNSFLAGGGDGFAVLKDGTNRKDGGDDLEALKAFFKAQASPFAVPLANRITRLN